MIVHLENAYLHADIDSRGAELRSLRTASGTEHLWDGDARYWKGRAPILFPCVGRMTEKTYRLHGHPYNIGTHGFAAQSEFTLLRQSAQSAVFALHESADTLRQYPFAFTLCVTYTLSDNALEMRLAITNDDRETMYFGVGGHPGLRVPSAPGLCFADYSLTFSRPCAPVRIGITPQGFVSGEQEPFALEDGRVLRLEHALFDREAIVLAQTSGAVTLQAKGSTSAVTVRYPDLPYLGFWQPAHTDAPLLCIEPWSSLPARDGIVEELSCKADLLSLAPRATHCSSIAIEINE